MDASHDLRILVNNKEWCLGCGAKTKGQVSSFFKMDFQKKVSKYGIIEKFKEGIDYEEMFAPVARYT